MTTDIPFEAVEAAAQQQGWTWPAVPEEGIPSGRQCAREFIAAAVPELRKAWEAERTPNPDQVVMPLETLRHLLERAYKAGHYEPDPRGGVRYLRAAAELYAADVLALIAQGIDPTQPARPREDRTP